MTMTTNEIMTKFYWRPAVSPSFMSKVSMTNRKYQLQIMTRYKQVLYKALQRLHCSQIAAVTPNLAD